MVEILIGAGGVAWILRYAHSEEDRAAAGVLPKIAFGLFLLFVGVLLMPGAHRPDVLASAWALVQIVATALTAGAERGRTRAARGEGAITP